MSVLGLIGMRVFSKISPALWQSKRFARLKSDNAKLLFMYLLTCTHQNSAGCYHLPDGYACSDLDWSQEKYSAALDFLVEAKLIQFDPECEDVMIERWFKHNPPMNPKHQKGIERMLDSIQSETLRNASLDDLEGVDRDKSKNQPRLPKSATYNGNPQSTAYSDRLTKGLMDHNR